MVAAKASSNTATRDGVRASSVIVLPSSNIPVSYFTSYQPSTNHHYLTVSDDRIGHGRTAHRFLTLKKLPNFQESILASPLSGPTAPNTTSFASLSHLTSVR